MRLVPFFLIGLLVSGIDCVFAQNSETKIDDELKDLNTQIMQLSDKQSEIIERLNENEAYVGTIAKNIDESLKAASNSFWYSSSLTTLIAVGLAIVGIVVSTWVGSTPVTREVGMSRIYAWRWIGLGVIIGLLGYMFLDFIRVVLRF